jgi:predicted TIM-barrel fold metal-dependent hydrolase
MYDLNQYHIDSETQKIYKEIFDNLVIVDSHVHIGEDIDKHKLVLIKLLKIMNISGVNKAICFPLHNPEYSKTFTKPNDQIHRSYLKYPERIIPFFRLNPLNDEWKSEYNKRVQQGFKGIKLHPRSQSFRINSTRIKDIVTKAEGDNLIILLHTGFGVKYLAEDLKNVVKKFPKVKFILGHSAFPDMDKVIKYIGEKDNVLFETSSLRTFDLFDLLKSLSYKKIIFGSDEPYYDQILSLEVLINTAIILKKTPNQIKDMLGGNIIRWLK